MNRRKMKEKISFLEKELSKRGFVVLNKGSYYKIKYKDQESIGYFNGRDLIALNEDSGSFFVVNVAEESREITSATYPEVIRHFQNYFNKKGITPGTLVSRGPGHTAEIPKEGFWTKPYQIQISGCMLFLRGVMAIDFHNQKLVEVAKKEEVLELGDVVSLGAISGEKILTIVSEDFLSNFLILREDIAKIFKKNSNDGVFLISLLNSLTQTD